MRLGLRHIRCALFHDDPPLSSNSLPDGEAGMIFLKWLAIEFPFSLPAMADDCRAIAQHSDDDIFACPVMQPIAWREDDLQNCIAVERVP